MNEHLTFIGTKRLFIIPQGDAISVLKKGIDDHFPGYGVGVEKNRQSLPPLPPQDLVNKKRPILNFTPRGKVGPLG
jgi:hypothetical protein